MIKITKVKESNYPNWIKESITKGCVKGPIYEFKDFIIYKVYYLGEGWNWEFAFKTDTKYHENDFEILLYEGAGLCAWGRYATTLAEVKEIIEDVYDNKDTYLLSDSFLPDGFMNDNGKVIINSKYMTKISDGTYKYVGPKGYTTTVKTYIIS